MKIQIITSLLTWIAILATCFFLVFFASSTFNGIYNHIIGDSHASAWQSHY